VDAFLASVITKKQVKAYANDGYVTEVAPSGNEWMIYPVWAGGVTIRFNDQRVVSSRCVHIATDQGLPGCICTRCRAASQMATLVPEVNIATIILYIRAGMEDYVLKTAK
jgi:hypothetical protein